ncbi:MAG: nucleotidyl transferase AbiEii/AbiGii toxin family protein [Candidatus Micrarchaeota archaeon]
MKIPLANKLKKRLHREIGLLQDEVLDIAYEIENSVILHGGTAIWRCYGGNRFSEDLDFYSKPRKFENEFEALVKRRGLFITKIKKTDNLVFSKISNGEVEVRAEFNFSKSVRGTLGTYERMDSSLTTIFTLSPEELIFEKIDAYSNRMLIRDIYDLVHLTAMVENPKSVAERMKSFLINVKKPVDEKNIKAIIYSGAVPSFEQMLEILKKRFSH